jgi:NAD(P)-dependent dehydrogenase (short-subunit alcohol dehydrogenase family)
MKRVAIVTGGASGIGRAIVAALVGRGDVVIVADLDADGAGHVAEVLSAHGTVTAAELDVTDAGAVRDLYEGVRKEQGRLDLVFNNAGIAIAGAAEELTLDHWNKAIDVNLRGVVHGVHAAYPIMLDQGYGHIVNTASLAGLVPMPLGIPYTATKHAVVGLSLGLRAEAAARGVQVSAVCPGFVDTPLLKNMNPGLPATGTEEPDVPGALYSSAALARDILRGVAKNQALIVAPASSRAIWRAMRLSPSGAVRIAGLAVGRIRK